MTEGAIEGGLSRGADRPLVWRPAGARLQLCAHLLLAGAGAALTVLFAFLTVRPGSHSTDFATFYASGRHVLHGLSPYPALSSLPAVADRTTFAPFVYPPPAAYAIVPIALLPFLVANAIFFCLSIAATILALRLLGVRDWPCYAAAFASVPVLAAPANGAISAYLLLGVAAAWRYRRRTWAPACAVAAVAVAKLFLWPLWLWLVYTRRYAAAALSAAIGATVTLVAWAALGFAGLREYPHLLSRLTELTGTNSYSLYALERAFGASPLASQAGLLVAGIAAVLLAARWLGGARTDERPFIVAIGLALLLSPILWPHYLILLFAPIAIVRPKMSGLWLLPLLFWFDANSWSFGEPARIAPALAFGALVIVTSLRTAR